MWLACHRCNKFKGNEPKRRDPVTQEMAPLFNPRLQTWREHFQWSVDGTQVMGMTPCGRATVDALQMNNEYVVEARRSGSLLVGILRWNSVLDTMIQSLNPSMAR